MKAIGLFKDVLSCLGDMSHEDKTKIWAMLTWNGGKVVTSLSPEVTHLIVNTPRDKLCEDALSIPNIKIVTCDWVQESIQTSSRLDEESYHPRLLVSPENNCKETPAVRTPAIGPASESAFLSDSGIATPIKPARIELRKKNQLPSKESEVENEPPPPTPAALAPSTPATPEVNPDVLSQIQNMSIVEDSGKLRIHSQN